MSMQKIIFKRRKAEFAIMIIPVIMCTFLIAFLDGYLLSKGKQLLDMAAIFLGTYIGFMGEIIYGMFFLPSEFRMAVSMGKTRKEFLRCEILVTMVWLLLIYLWIGFVYGIGRLVGGVVNGKSNIMEAFQLSDVVKSVIIVIFAILLIVVLQFTVFLATESNKKFVSLFWILHMLGSIFLGKIREYFDGVVNGLSGVLSGEYVSQMILVGIFAVLLLWGGVVIKKLLRLQVKLP